VESTHCINKWNRLPILGILKARGHAALKPKGQGCVMLHVKDVIKVTQEMQRNAMNMPPTRGLGTVHESHKFNIRRSSVLFKCKTTTLNCVASSCSRLYLGPIQVNQ